jgi:hypothetical protein
MAIKVKSSGESAAKWATNAGAAATEYATQASGAGADWEANTKAAAPNFRAAVSAGGIEKRFSGGVSRAGAAKYTRGINTKGSGRYAGGVQAGQQDYSAGVEPYLQTIASLTLPARQPRGSEANNARVSTITKALSQRRLAIKGAGG